MYGFRCTALHVRTAGLLLLALLPCVMVAVLLHKSDRQLPLVGARLSDACMSHAQLFRHACLAHEETTRARPPPPPHNSGTPAQVLCLVRQAPVAWPPSLTSYFQIISQVSAPAW